MKNNIKDGSLWLSDICNECLRLITFTKMNCKLCIIYFLKEEIKKTKEIKKRECKNVRNKNNVRT